MLSIGADRSIGIPQETTCAYTRRCAEYMFFSSFDSLNTIFDEQPNFICMNMLLDAIARSRKSRARVPSRTHKCGRYLEFMAILTYEG